MPRSTAVRCTSSLKMATTERGRTTQGSWPWEGGGAEEYFSFTIPVGCTPYLMNSTRLHKVFQNFLVPWKIQMV
jgi:hypothetical protein